MGDLRKDYVLDKFVVMHEASQMHQRTGIAMEKEKMPILPGNESMTEPATLALVVKEGMLQRLSDSEDSIIDDWSVRVFQSENPVVVTGSATSYSDKPLYSEPAYGYHQIVVASPEHNQSLSHISVEQWGNVLVVIQDRKVALHAKRCDVCLNLCEQRCQRRCAGNPSSPKHRYFFFYTSSYRHGGRRLTQVHE